jgi:signal transduction histidine kinase
MDQQVETLQQQLKEQEKLSALGMLSAGIAHEIQNPLNFVINFSKMSGKLIGELTEIVDDNKGNISDDDRADLQEIMTDLQDNIARIEEHSQRAVGIVRDILLVARGKADERLPTDVGRIVK